MKVDGQFSKQIANFRHFLRVVVITSIEIEWQFNENITKWLLIFAAIDIFSPFGSTYNQRAANRKNVQSNKRTKKKFGNSVRSSKSEKQFSLIILAADFSTVWMEQKRNQFESIRSNRFYNIANNFMPNRIKCQSFFSSVNHIFVFHFVGISQNCWQNVTK